MEYKDLVFTYWLITLSIMILYAIISILVSMYKAKKVIIHRSNLNLDDSTNKTISKKKTSDFGDIEDIDITIANYQK